MFKTLVLTCCSVLILASNVYGGDNPSILFCSPQGTSYGWIDLTYLSEIHEKGFEVDYTENMDELTWERISKYNVLVVFTCPRAAYYQPKINSEGFVDLLEKYLDSGGGVFVIAQEKNMTKQVVAELMDRWGIKIPVERIREKDPEKIAPMSNMGFEIPLAFTDQILPSPVSNGIKHIWYPYMDVYNAQQTCPLWLNKDWQAVIKASKTSETEPVDLKKSPSPDLENPFYRPEGKINEPPLFAIRSYKQGRIAFISQWQQFSVGAGTKWLYDREVLSKGLKGKGSDFGKLLENTFTWLAELSLGKDMVGGYKTTSEKLVPPNKKPGAKKDFEEIFWHHEPEVLGYGRPPKDSKIFRGIIGVKSKYSSGENSIAEYAEAAKRLSLDFLVFIEDFEKITKDSFEGLKSECKKYSNEKVKLFAGYTIDNNIGNHLFIFGPEVTLPPDYCLTGPKKNLLNQQYQDEKGNYTLNAVVLNWIHDMYIINQTKGQVGFYNFVDSKKNGGMDLQDLRLYSMAAIRYYAGGKLIEDVTNDYLTCAQGTIPPGPVSFNLVTSVTGLEEEVKNNHSLTYVQAKSLSTAYMDGLRWTQQYDGINIFPSDGPKILSWPGCHRVMTYGGEEFVTGRIFMPSFISVSSEKGLKEIRIYNGENLFRRFILDGEKEFSKMLMLEGSIQKNLVLVTEDVKGGKAVSFARRCWKEGAEPVVFCGDHCNDCGYMFLAHGPYPVSAVRTPQVPGAGDTWDGGPPAVMPIVIFQENYPYLESDKGIEDGYRFNQTPLLEFTDEGASAVTSVRNEVFDEKIEVVNPWYTYGPKKPSRLFNFTLRFRTWVIPSIDTPGTGWPGSGVRVGIKPCLFREEITFKEDLKINKLRMLRNFHPIRVDEAFLVLGTGDKIKIVEFTKLAQPETFSVGKGEWFGFASTKTANSHLFINRGEPIYIQITDPKQGGDWVTIWLDVVDKEVKKGDTLTCELFSLNYPLNTAVKNVNDFVYMINYLDNPDGLKILKGKRVKSPGILEFEGKDYVVEVSIPKPKKNTQLTLPVRIQGLNNRWSAGLLLKKGYVKGDYGKGENRYTPLGIDMLGNAYLPVYVDWSDVSWIAAGHPVIADSRGKELFIQVTSPSGGTGEPPSPYKWYIEVNNPTDKTIITTLKRVIDLPGLEFFGEREITLKPGEDIIFKFDGSDK